MKKGLSIVLLIIFLFNVGGYYIIFWGIKFQIDQQLSYRLDANLYDPDETLELKVPMTLPYPIHSNGFERVNGRFEHNGQYYKLIKQKYQNDTLYVVCIRDQDTRALVSTMKEYVESSLGLAGASTGQKALKFLSKLVKDFYSQQDITFVHKNGVDILPSSGERPESFLQPEIPVHAPPPRFQS